MGSSLLTRRAVLGLALAPAVLAACGGSEDLEALPKTGASPGSLVYATWGTQERVEREHWSLLSFEKNYSDLRVSVIASETAAEHVAKQISLRSAGGQADVIRLPSWVAPTFYYEDGLTRLDPYFKRDGFRTDHLAPPFDVATFQRHWYALPRGQAGTYVMHYNRGLFTQAGHPFPSATWTWDDFLRAARALTRPNAPGGSQWGVSLESLVNFYYPWLWGNGGDDLEHQGTRSTIAGAPARDALQWLAALRLDHKVAPPPGEVPEGMAAFSSGRVAMWFGPADAEMDLAQVSGLDYGIAPQPKGKQGQQAGYKPDVVGITAGSQNINDAWEFMQFLVDVETQRLEFDNALWLPQTKDIVKTAAYRKPATVPHDRSAAIPGEGIKARTPVMVPRGDEIRAVTLRALAPLWTGAKGVKETTDTAAQAADAILHGEA